MSKNNHRNLSPEEIDQLLGTKDERIYRKPTNPEVEHILHQFHLLQKEHLQHNRLDLAELVSDLIRKIEHNELDIKVHDEGDRLLVNVLENDEGNESQSLRTWSFYIDLERNSS